jgi:hypothetical protein
MANKAEMLVVHWSRINFDSPCLGRRRMFSVRSGGPRVHRDLEKVTCSACLAVAYKKKGRA